jgi:diguanylate cyclase (GGDEF)-like protein
MADTVKRMDRTEVTKRVERAEKLLQKGKTAEALEDYLQVLAAEPGNDTVCQMAADLCLSLQRIPQAVKLLGDLFERQIEAGDATRASLTYKKLARFVPPTWEQKLRFGELLEKSHPKQALETYDSVFQELAKQGRKQDSLAALKRVLALDSSEKNLQRLGELSSELGESKAAAAAFLKLAQTAQPADAAQWMERAYAEDPADPQIALGYSKNLLAQGQSGAAIFVLESQVNAGSASEELRDTYVKALLAANRLSDAEPILWQLFEENPSRVQEIANLIGLFIDGQQDAEAVALGRKLEQYHRRKGDRRAFLTMIQDISARHRASPELLEFMGEQFNASNRESDYCQTLLKLFDLYCSVGNYAKAADSLDRAAEVDAYEPGHQKRLEMLHGKIDENRFKVIASRFSSMADTAAAPLPDQDKMLGAAALQDLMLQAEILVQYGMRSKAVERLQRIQELFPREEERNQDLRQLYMTAGLIPHYAGSAPAPAGAASAPVDSRTLPPQAGPAQSSESADVSSFARVAEITRKLYRQSNADAVMLTAAKEIGSQWKVSRCVVAMRKPGLHTTSVKEYCSELSKPAEARALEKIATTVHDLAINRGGTLTVADAQTNSDLQAVREALAHLAVTSLLALPLSDGAEHVGLLLLMDSKPHSWGPNDVMVLKTITDQIVIALNNAGLRRLVKNLSVTDERSGLLKRVSYLDLLMAETRRNAQQSTPLTVLLMQFGEKAAMVKEFGESAIETAMQQIGQLFAANIRQNDLAFRYETTTIAIVLGETPEKEGVMAAEKLQRLLAQIRMPEKQEPIQFSAGLAEAVVRGEYDPVDIVTEVINRAEQALHTAIGQGTGKIVALAASYAAAAVA